MTGIWGLPRKEIGHDDSFALVVGGHVLGGLRQPHGASHPSDGRIVDYGTDGEDTQVDLGTADTVIVLQYCRGGNDTQYATGAAANEWLEQYVGLIYGQMGRRSLESIENVGPRLAGVMEPLVPGSV